MEQKLVDDIKTSVDCIVFKFKIGGSFIKQDFTLSLNAPGDTKVAFPISRCETKSRRGHPPG